MWLTTDELNFVYALPTAYYDNTITTNFPCAVVNMARYESMVAIVNLNCPSTVAMWVNEYAALTPSAAGTAVAHISANYRYSNSTGTTVDTLSSRTAMGTTAITVTAATTAALAYYIEWKSSDLDAAYPYVGVAISTSATASTGMSVTYVMRPRYPQKTMATAVS